MGVKEKVVAPGGKTSGTDYDVLVIGGGPGGYVCAIRAAQLGFKVACVEKRSTLGGTCLNVGCIPSKALLQSSENYTAIRHDSSSHGIIVSGIDVSIERMQARKQLVVDSNVKGVEYLLKKNGITWIKGKAWVESAGRVKVGDCIITARYIVVASGSVSTEMMGVDVDEKTIVTSTGGLELTSIPQTMVVIGGGVIGLELGSIWHRLGTKVTIVEYGPRILPNADGDLAKAFDKFIKKDGIEIFTSTKVLGAERSSDSLILSCCATEGYDFKLEGDIILVAIGRHPASQNMGLEKSGVTLDNRGCIEVNDRYETVVPGIYAIGDVVKGPMLAHKAEEEGIAVAEILAGQAGHVNYDAIPSVVYTCPELAWVGKTEDDLRRDNISFKVGRFPFSANGRSRAMGTTDGFVKILADARTDKILGVHVMGVMASELISECVIGLEFGASSEDIARICHAHPTLSESIREAALAVEDRAIHF